MVAFIISFSSQHSNDPDWNKAYGEMVKPLLIKHKAEIISRGKPENGERAKDWERATLIKFPSKAQARSFLDDPDYHHAKGLRIYHTSGEMYLLGDEA
ncbi:MAG: hypothetical protein CFH01_01892 [Alphaproteobacteria bacterium MarineAlpha2_Bin1]|nr:MAG: hypothetical protein CFH01_01892 [Alphaproteobacteria bacterium MarineAlpha2_Bin1]